MYQTIAAIVNSQMTSYCYSADSDGHSFTYQSKPTQTPATADPIPKITPTPGGVTQTATPTSLCDQAGAGNPIDVTIPDDSVILPGAELCQNLEAGEYRHLHLDDRLFGQLFLR